ncbi:MAG: rhomboid family intramembrane serine protease [Pseudomonadota bacterium]
MTARPPLTLALVGISILVFAAQNLFSESGVLMPLLISEYLQPALPEIKSGEVWRLVTPIFLHFGLFHVVFNLLWTWELGRLIEARQGSLWLGVVVLISAVVSNLTQFHVSGPVFGGMSGVVYALFGYVWVQGQFNRRFGVRLNPPIVYLMVGWFVICWTGILEKLFGLQVANTAHTAGLGVGILLSFVVLAVAHLKSR